LLEANKANKMASTTINEKLIYEGSAPTTLARVIGNDGSAIQQSDYGDISFEIFKDADTTATVSGTCTVASVVFDTYQTDSPRWTVDSIGYNFRHSTLLATYFADGDATYRLEYKFEPTGQQPFWVVFLVTTVEIRSE